MDGQKKEINLDDNMIKDLKDAFHFMQTYIAMYPAKSDSEKISDIAVKVARELGISNQRKDQLIALIKQSGATGLDDIKNFCKYARALVDDDDKQVKAQKEEWDKSVKGLESEDSFKKNFKKADKDFRKKRRKHITGSIWRIALIVGVASLTVFGGTLGFVAGSLINFVTTTAGGILGGLSTAVTSLLALYLVEKYVLKIKKNDKKDKWYDWFGKAKKDKRDALASRQKLHSDRQKSIDDVRKRGVDFQKHQAKHRSFEQELNRFGEEESLYGRAATVVSEQEKSVKERIKTDEETIKEERLQWLQYIKSLIYKGIADGKITKDNIDDVMSHINKKYANVLKREAFRNLALSDAEELKVDGINGYIPVIEKNDAEAENLA